MHSVLSAVMDMCVRFNDKQKERDLFRQAVGDGNKTNPVTMAHFDFLHLKGPYWGPLMCRIKRHICPGITDRAKYFQFGIVDYNELQKHCGKEMNATYI